LSTLAAALRGFSGRLAAGMLMIGLAWLVAATPASAADTSTLEIVSKSGVHVFTVELAVNDEQRGRGLMYRKELAQGHGMLFDFQNDQPVSFWMHNTFIPLDMIFIAGDGRITHIAENAQPQSDRLIPSNGPVRAVLEVIAGTVHALGIAPGDKVAHPIFGNRR
jgi:uncharacterized membrane protein (UPF0127 family)